MRPTEVRRTPKKQCCPDPYSVILFLRKSTLSLLFYSSADQTDSFLSLSQAPLRKVLALFLDSNHCLCGSLQVAAGRSLRHSLLAHAIPSRFLPMQFHRGSLRSFADPLRLFAMRSLSAAFRFLPKLSRGLAARIQTCLYSAMPLQGDVLHSDPAAQHRPSAPLPGLPVHIFCVAMLTRSTAMLV